MSAQVQALYSGVTADPRVLRPTRVTDGTSAGSGYLERKANGDVVYHAPWVALTKRKPFTIPPLNPRIERPARTAERIEKNILAALDRWDQAQRDRLPAIGRPCANGYRLTATDGHRALLAKGPVAGKPLPWLGKIGRGYRLAVIDDPEFHLALKRALIATNVQSRQVKLIAHGGTLTVTGESDEVMFDETLAIRHTVDFRVALNGVYLEPMCGSWPLRVWVKDEDSAVIFEPADRSWRYVVMPVRAEWPEPEHG